MKGSQELHKGHMDKTKAEGGSKGGRWVCMGEGGIVDIVIEQQ